MLTFADVPTIKNAIRKRLDAETGLEVLEMVVKKHPRHIFVGVLTEIDKHLHGGKHPVAKSIFHLPPMFDYRHLHDEIDQVAEQCKAARRCHQGRAGRGQTVNNAEVQLLGTGERGLWRKYA